MLMQTPLIIGTMALKIKKNTTIACGVFVILMIDWLLVTNQI